MSFGRPPPDKDPCPACERVVARWTNNGRIPPHGKRRVRHKCPHGLWCQQGDPKWGTHSNGRQTGCGQCTAKREAKLNIIRHRPRKCHQQLVFIEFGPKEGRSCHPALPGPFLTEGQPTRIWTLWPFIDKDKPPGLPFTPIHRTNAWHEDVTHDWTVDSQGRLRYYSRITDEPVWLLLEYDDPKESP